jgi:ribosomal protein S18
VREMMVKPGAEFTADTVVEASLRQDVGPDRSISGKKQKYQYQNESNFGPIIEYKKKYRDKWPVLAPEAYFTGHDRSSRQERLAAYDMEKPSTFINRPLNRSQIRKRFMRHVKKDDIDWRNTAMISKFLNESGKLYNRF